MEVEVEVKVEVAHSLSQVFEMFENTTRFSVVGTIAGVSRTIQQC